MLEENINRYSSVGFPPPLLAQFQKLMASISVFDGIQIIEICHKSIAVLYDTDVLLVTITDHADKWIFLC